MVEKADKERAQQTAKRRLASYGLLLVLAGFGLSVYLSLPYVTGSAPQWCEMSEHVSCSRVLASSYAKVLSIPLAFYGVMYFLVGFGFAAFLAGPRTDDREVAAGFYMFALVGVLSVGYFVYAEIMVGALCLSCTLVHLVVLALVVVARKLVGIRWPGWSPTPAAVVRLAWDLRIWLLVVLLVVGTPVLTVQVAMTPDRVYSDQQLEQWGACLRRQRMEMFSKPDCPYCSKQKELLGAAADQIKIVSCETASSPGCEGIHAYPTWIKRTNSAYVREIQKGGLLTLSQLETLSTCKLPKA